MIRKLLMLCCALLVHSSIVVAAVYNYGTDWAPPANPNGVWSYESVSASVADPVANVSTFNTNRALRGYNADEQVYKWTSRIRIGQTTLTPDNLVAALVVWTAPEEASCVVTGSLQSPVGEDNLLFKVLFQDVSAGTITELYSGTTIAGGAAITWKQTVTVETGDEILFYMPADGAYGQGSTNGDHPWEAGVVTAPLPPPTGTLIIIQ